MVPFAMRRSTGPAVRVGPALGDEVPVPAQQGCRLDEEASETLAGEQSCESGQHRPVGWLQHRSVDLASEHRHLVAQHDDLDGEVRVAATGSRTAGGRGRTLGRGTRGPSPDARRAGVQASKSSFTGGGWHSRHPQVAAPERLHMHGPTTPAFVLAEAQTARNLQCPRHQVRAFFAPSCVCTGR